MSPLGKKITFAIRHYFALTQETSETLAKKLRICPSTVRMWLRNGNVSSKHSNRLCRLLNLPILDLKKEAKASLIVDTFLYAISLKILLEQYHKISKSQRVYRNILFHLVSLSVFLELKQNNIAATITIDKNSCTELSFDHSALKISRLHISEVDDTIHFSITLINHKFVSLPLTEDSLEHLINLINNIVNAHI